mmetsp:Transcript_10879/g.16067  ORF Transcript_10879/g.16067 Transcript_10879/m.16067 type:complete len:181 (-) Transcript_10879:425-967(-)|eukprot:CAMPEP_0113938798 /NCGR_PEP_ID=MMETSP1339-20121228/5223_1 /TAXON_ID=94617 /ORGANISM="Fibrocapsa japonica" /LENGTH=180 /DNA_ID=CAMNT_0000942083 /DNA_START=141 /DNA_END=683 /DNA_ORIENTATION=- /assembly_acc=CAM_ASM_000762
MLVYKDLFTGDELMSDSHKINPVVDEDGEEVPGLFEVESRTIAVGGDNIDIGCGNAFGGGDEDVDDNVEKENNIISESAGFGYTEIPFGSKAEFKAYLKDHVRKIRSELKANGKPQAEIKQFMSEAPEFVKWLLGMYSEFQFYVGRAINPEACFVYAYYKEGALNPTFVFIKEGLLQEKF